MLGNEGQASAVVKLLDPVSAAATANATSANSIPTNQYEGDVEVTVQVGALTGTIAWTIEDSADGTSGFATVTPNEGAFAAGAANQVQKRTVKAKALRGFIRVVGTIVTGPALVAASFRARPKNI